MCSCSRDQLRSRHTRSCIRYYLLMQKRSTGSNTNGFQMSTSDARIDTKVYKTDLVSNGFTKNGKTTWFLFEIQFLNLFKLKTDQIGYLVGLIG
jgi:hypothetical protein